MGRGSSALAMEALDSFVGKGVRDAAMIIASGIKREARVVANATKTIWKWWNDDVPPWIRNAVYCAVIGAAIGATLMFIAYLILGFGPMGVVKGSIAASIHSGIGNVAAGSWFATMQSLGATGALPGVMTGIGAGVGAVIGAATGAVWSSFTRK